MRNWLRNIWKMPGPDRVERLLHSCESYYHAGDRDIAVLLLREVEKELVRPPLFEPVALTD